MRSIDELNNITFDEEEYFKEYFEPMDIPEEAKKEREEASEDIFDLLLFMFLLIDENLETGAFAYNDLLMEFQRRYADIIATYGRNDAYFQSYLGMVSGEILDTTIRNLDNEYYTSRERAASVSANEANSILNYEELQRKIDEGYTHKTWKAEIDRKTRLDHDEMNGTTIPIEEYFIFPDCEMLMPHDEVNGTARQVVNCRCSLIYSSQQNRVENSLENDSISNRNRDRTSYQTHLGLQFFGNKTKHANYRQEERKISEEDIQDALNFPLDDPYNYFDINNNGQPSIKYIGEKVTVVINPDDERIVTCFKTDKRVARRLKNGN